jgi:regulator of protease activity HflC (stomatin/prohibitin superfamily)
VIRVVAALVVIIVLLVIVGLTAVGRSIRVVQQYEKGIIYRFGRVLPEVRGPGLHIIRPIGDRMQKVNMQIVAMAVPAQDGITRDNVSVRVDAVVYFRVVDPIKATVNVQDYMFAIAQQAQTSLRSIIGQSEMDQLLAERESVNRELRRVIDEPTEAPWGIRVERVEVKDVSLPEGMKRSMSRQAEAERERRARIITADGEYQASKRLAAAANVMARDPAALQLRLLQTVVEVAGERNSTLVMPVPVELLRFFDRMTPGAQQPAAERLEEPEDLGDAEVAEAEAEIAGVNVPALDEGAIPPAPAVDTVTGQVNELLSAATSPDILASATPETAEDLPSAAEGLPRVDAEDLPSAEVPVTPDSEDTTSFPVVDPASPNGAADTSAADTSAADTEAAAPVRKPRASTPRKPRTTATARKPRTTGERAPGRQADR